MRCHRRTIPLLLLAPIFLTFSGCDSSDSPTEPVFRSSVSLSASNASAETLWFRRWGPSSVFELRPGASVEFWWTRSTGTWISPADGQFDVLLPMADGTVPGAAWATVQYHVDGVCPSSDLFITVYLSIDASRSLVVTSDNPELFHVVRVTYP